MLLIDQTITPFVLLTSFNDGPFLSYSNQRDYLVFEQPVPLRELQGTG